MKNKISLIFFLCIMNFHNSFSQPANAKIIIECNDETKFPAVVFVSEMIGKILFTQKIFYNFSEMLVSELPSGMYQISISNEKFLETKKFVKE